MPGLSRLIMASEFVVHFDDRVGETGVPNLFNEFDFLRHGPVGLSN